MIYFLCKAICSVIYPFWFAYKFCKLFPENYRNAILASKRDWRDQIRQHAVELKSTEEFGPGMERFGVPGETLKGFSKPTE
jgi:hypothetical protein